MKQLLNHPALPALGALVALLALKGVHGADLWAGTPVADSGRTLVTTLANRDMNKEAREALTAGYYEGLINEGSRVSSMNRLVTDARRPTWEDRAQPDRRQTNDFLFYELIPNSDTPDYRDERFRYNLKTNSAGMPDREYALEKPAGTRRLALLGDSISRGQGAPFQGNFEALLEAKLNAAHTGGPVRQFEVLNFSVGSYSVMQMMESAFVKAAPYEPDVYLVGLTHLSVYRRWGHHVALLLNSGIDLKYDYMRDLVRQAGLAANEPLGAVDAKLARFRIPTIRWALGEIKAHAERHGATVVVLLLPTAEPPENLDEAFLGVREMLAELELPVVDLLDTFSGVADHATVRVADNDRHPNALGHQMLADRLYERVLASDALRPSLLAANAGRTDE